MLTIIGTSKEGLLISATTEDWYNCMGYSSYTSAAPLPPSDLVRRGPKVGDTVEVEAFYRWREAMNKHETRLKNVADTMEHQARIIRCLAPLQDTIESADEHTQGD